MIAVKVVEPYDRDWAASSVPCPAPMTHIGTADAVAVKRMRKFEKMDDGSDQAYMLIDRMYAFLSQWVDNQTRIHLIASREYIAKCTAEVHAGRPQLALTHN